MEFTYYEFAAQFGIVWRHTGSLTGQKGIPESQLCSLHQADMSPSDSMWQNKVLGFRLRSAGLGNTKARFGGMAKDHKPVSLTLKLLETKAATESISWFPTLTVLRVLACTFILAKVLLSFDQTRRSQISRLIEPASSGMAPLLPTARTASQNWQENGLVSLDASLDKGFKEAMRPWIYQSLISVLIYLPFREHTSYSVLSIYILSTIVIWVTEALSASSMSDTSTHAHLAWDPSKLRTPGSSYQIQNALVGYSRYSRYSPFWDKHYSDYSTPWPQVPAWQYVAILPHPATIPKKQSWSSLRMAST